jgi:hypothetical protein
MPDIHEQLQITSADEPTIDQQSIPIYKTKSDIFIINYIPVDLPQPSLFQIASLELPTCPSPCLLLLDPYQCNHGDDV